MEFVPIFPYVYGNRRDLRSVSSLESCLFQSLLSLPVQQLPISISPCLYKMSIVTPLHSEIINCSQWSQNCGGRYQGAVVNLCFQGLWMLHSEWLGAVVKWTGRAGADEFWLYVSSTSELPSLQL